MKIKSCLMVVASFFIINMSHQGNLVKAESFELSMENEISKEENYQEFQEESSNDETIQEETISEQETTSQLPPPPDPPSTINIDETSLETTEPVNITSEENQTTSQESSQEDSSVEESSQLETSTTPLPSQSIRNNFPAVTSIDSKIISPSKRLIAKRLIHILKKLFANLSDRFTQLMPLPQILVLPVKLFIYYLSTIAI